jgi:Ca2+-binding EF-hand superfamily protein
MMELRGWFKSVDKDNSGHITARELSQMQFAGQKFSMDTAQKLIKVSCARWCAFLCDMVV